MIKTFTLCTAEVDDVEVATREILDQLKGQTLLKNTVGIVACHQEYVLSGAAKAICEALPFDVAGTVTTGQAVSGERGILLFTAMVMTSDDVVFKTVITSSLLGDYEKAIREAYAIAAKDVGRPALVLSFAGFMLENSGDEYVRVITDASGGAPCFGTLAVDDSLDFASSFMIYNGEHYRDCMAMVLAFGDIRPKFYIGTISKEKIIERPALITASNGHVLKEVNGRPVIEFFEEMGLKEASETAYAMNSVPMMLDYNDGTPQVSKVFISLNERGEAICAGAMPEGSSLYFGVFDKEDVLLTTGKAVHRAIEENPDCNGMLMYSCISRNMSLIGDILAEADIVSEKAGDCPFMMVYSGGEMCPTTVGSAGAINRFHNNTFILCII